MGIKPQCSGGGGHMAGTMDTCHASKKPSHGSLAADNTHVDWVLPEDSHGSTDMREDFTGPTLLYQLVDDVYEYHTMDNMALISQ